MGARVEPVTYRVLAYGFEKKALPHPAHSIGFAKCKVEFAEFKGAPRFQDFDGVIVFQGTFESFEHRISYWDHEWSRDELDKRTKEAYALIEKGGFVCLVLTDPFIDFDRHIDFRETDLSKRLLYGHLLQREFPTRVTNVKSKVNELRKFFELYGVACSWFPPSTDDAGIKVLASAHGGPVSVVIDGRVFAIPALIPKPEEADLVEFLEILVSGVVALWESFKRGLPDWADEYRFPEEHSLIAKKVELASALSDIAGRLENYRVLKRVLVAQGEPLVEDVMEVFARTLPLKPKREDAFREDLSLLDSDGNSVALAEVKGVSRGVSREHINQADSHRERNGLPPEFPSLLIVNTNLKNAGSIVDKDQSIAAEQIQHAARNNVLVLRTLDLLNLASLHLKGTLNSEEVVRLLTTSRGWLRVSDSAAEVLSS
jgi:hypothetical protein